MSALERVPNNIIQINPYLLAISTYALALSNSSKKEEFRNKLYAIKRDIGGIDFNYMSLCSLCTKRVYFISLLPYSLFD